MSTEILAGVIVAMVVAALVAVPLFRKPAKAPFRSEGEIRNEVNRYRAAIKAKTLCDRCLTANPAGSNFCSECGRSL